MYIIIYKYVLYKQVKSPWNNSHNLSDNMHVPNIMYWDFNHSNVHKANDGNYIRIVNNYCLICGLETRYILEIHDNFRVHILTNKAI